MDDVDDDSSVPLHGTALLANIVTLIALMIYIYSVLGCYIFRRSFIRQIAYIFQSIKLFLICGALLPYVLHCQISHVLPALNINKRLATMTIAVLCFLLLNLFLAMALKALFRYMSTRGRLEGKSPAFSRRHKRNGPSCGKKPARGCGKRRRAGNCGGKDNKACCVLSELLRDNLYH